MLELIAANPLIRYTVLVGIFGLAALAALVAMNFLDRRVAMRSELRAIANNPLASRPRAPYCVGLVSRKEARRSIDYGQD